MRNPDDRPPADEELPIRSSEVAIAAWTPSEDMDEEIITQQRRVCNEPVRD